MTAVQKPWICQTTISNVVNINVFFTIVRYKGRAITQYFLLFTINFQCKVTATCRSFRGQVPIDFSSCVLAFHVSGTKTSGTVSPRLRSRIQTSTHTVFGLPTFFPILKVIYPSSIFFHIIEGHSNTWIINVSTNLKHQRQFVVYIMHSMQSLNYHCQFCFNIL